MPLLTPEFIFYLLAAAIPAYIMNRYLMKWIKPRQSFGRFMLYLLAVLGVAFLYTLLVCLFLVKYVWPVR